MGGLIQCISFYAMHLSLTFQFVKLAKSPSSLEKILIFLHDHPFHRLKYYGQSSSERLLQDGANAGRKELSRALPRKENSMKRCEEIGTREAGFQKAIKEQKAVGARMRWFSLRLQQVVWFISFLQCWFGRLLKANVSTCFRRLSLVLICN